MPLVVDPTAGTAIDAPASQNLVFGAFKLTFTFPAGGTYEYIVEELTFERKYREIETMNEIGVPNKVAYVKTRRKGTCTLQTKANDTIVPPVGSTAVVPEIGGVSGVTIVVTSDGQAYNHSDATKIKFDISEVLN
jgi:hypothetical protein